MWMNEAEIDNALEIIEARAPQFYKYAKFLSDWRHVVNANSDGWAYWKAGSDCAKALQIQVTTAVMKVRGHRDSFPTEAEFKAALTPIRSLATKRKLKAPELVDDPPKPAPAEAPAALTGEVFVAAAQRHGQDSEPDHEVGDLQTFFRAAFGLLTPAQQAAFYGLETVRETVENALGLDPLPAGARAAEALLTELLDDLLDDAPSAPKP